MPPKLPLNRIAVVLTPDDQKTFQTGLAMIESVVFKFPDLSGVDMRSLPQPGDGAGTWVSSALNYMEAYPALKADYIDQGEFAQDIDAMDATRTMLQPLDVVRARLINVFRVCAGQAFETSLTFLQDTKARARGGVPNAGLVVTGLTTTYPRKQKARTKRTGDQPPPAGTPAAGTQPSAA
jgi:hypothetical protein